MCHNIQHIHTTVLDNVFKLNRLDDNKSSLVGGVQVFVGIGKYINSMKQCCDAFHTYQQYPRCCIDKFAIIQAVNCDQSDEVGEYCTRIKSDSISTLFFNCPSTTISNFYTFII